MQAVCLVRLLAKGGAPERRPRGPAEQGSGSGGDAAAALMVLWDARIPLRGRIFLWKTLLRPPRSRPILLQPEGTGLCGRVALSGSSRRGAPKALHEGPAKRDRAASGDAGDRDYGLTGGVHPAAGSHLPSEGTAPPFAVAPFASSPFAHPIPQSRRRARAGFIQRFLNLCITTTV